MNSSNNNRTLTQGDYVNWYRIERVLGHGGFGITYLATDTNLDHLVALKEYLPANLVRRADDKTIAPLTARSRVDYEHGLQSFLREARTLVKFRHPNIVRVMSVFEANNSAYLVMEYERGVEFREYVKRNHDIGELALIELFLHIIDGLDQVHQTGYLHRDIKPVNLIIRDNGTPVLLDFGSSRRLDNAAANTSFVSAGYTALEQYREGSGPEVGPWTDIYALGGTLYFAICGDPPINPVSRLAAHINGSADPLKSATEIGADRYSEMFLQAVDWALSFQIADRPQTLAEWKVALERARDQVSLEDDTGGDNQVYQSSVPEVANEHPATSRLRVRNRATVNDKSRKKPAPARTNFWLAMVIASVLVVVASIGLRAFRDQQRLNDQLAQAETGLEKTLQPLPSIQRFRDVLDRYPENERAQRGLLLGKAKLQQLALEQIDSDQLDAAAETIQSLQALQAPTTRLTGQLEAARREQSIRQQLEQIASLNSLGQFQQSLEQIAIAREQGADSRFDPLEQAAQQGVESAQAEQRQQEARQRAAQTRIAEAMERQRVRRREYSSYLSSTESALLRGDINTARRWLESARALQIDDQMLADLDRRVGLEEKFASQPLTEYEIRYASSRFNALRQAIETSNQALISQLTEGRPSRQQFFESLYERYAQLTFSVINIESQVDPKRVTATLRIEKLGLPNGDIVYPSASYRDTKLTVQRNRHNWSKIIW